MLHFKKNVPYSRRMVVYGIFDVLDSMDCQYEQALIGDIHVQATILDHVSRFAFAVTEETPDTSILHVSMLCPPEGMGEEEQGLAVEYLMDCVLRHIQEEHAR